MPRYKRVLIVDDDPIIRSIFCSYFSDQGVSQILEAENGKKAIEIIDAKQGQIDLIQLDIYMPETDGIEVLKHLGIVGFGGDVAIVSGASDTDRANAGSFADIYGLNLVAEITKPITRDPRGPDLYSDSRQNRSACLF